MFIVVLSVYVEQTKNCVISYMNNAVLNLKVFFRLTQTRRMFLVEYERLTVPVHPRSHPIIMLVFFAQSLVFCEVCCKSLFVIFSSFL